MMNPLAVRRQALREDSGFGIIPEANVWGSGCLVFLLSVSLRIQISALCGGHQCSSHIISWGHRLLLCVEEEKAVT